MLIVSPAGEGGVQDYARLMAKRLEAAVAVFVGDRLIDDEHRLHDADVVLLQFSGYGFQSRGVPLALLHWVKKQKQNGKMIGVVFHELYAFGPPWTSAFWVSALQRHIAAEMACVADFWITNRQASADWLVARAGQKPCAVLPTCSNVGELTRFGGPREKSLVVFGGSGLRARAYAECGDALFAWALRHGVRIHDIGPPLDDAKLLDQLSAAGAQKHGRLNQQDVSRMLATSAFGLVSYPMAYAAKSGVLAAYCAHGVCPIIRSAEHNCDDGLVSDVHYCSDFAALDPSDPRCSAIGRAAWGWYQAHAVGCHLEIQRTLLGQG